jgi:hypothetical protein
VKSCQENTDRGGKLVYQVRAPFLSVVGKSLHLIALLVLRKLRMALKLLTWSFGSVNPSYEGRLGSFSSVAGIGALIISLERAHSLSSS